jgi:hypothetical protein
MDQNESISQGNDDETTDQDSEPTLNAPEEGRPDGLEALKDGGSGEDPDEQDTAELPVSAEGTGDDLAGGLGRP